MHWEDVLSQATNCDQVITHEKNAHIHTYIHTLHYITSHHITLHYITDIHTLHTYIHAHSDVWFKSYGPVAASDERGRVPTLITAVRVGRVTRNRICVTGCVSGLGRVRRLDGDALTLRVLRASARD